MLDNRGGIAPIIALFFPRNVFTEYSPVCNLHGSGYSTSINASILNKPGPKYSLQLRKQTHLILHAIEVAVVQVELVDHNYYCLLMRAQKALYIHRGVLALIHTKLILFIHTE